MIRVAICDDHPVVRDGLRALLSSLPGVEFAGEATTGAEAVRLAVTSMPDVLIMDLRMPDLDGASATAQIRRAAPQIGVLVLTMVEDDGTVFAAMRAGASGYLVKGATQQQIGHAIATVADGGVIFGPAVARQILGYLATPTGHHGEPFPELTPRERGVLDLIAAGLSNSAIASRLGLARKTVGNHISSIFMKLQVATRAEAAARGRQAGLGS